MSGEPIADTKVRIMDDHREELKENYGNIEIKGSAVLYDILSTVGRQPVEDGWLSTGDRDFTLVGHYML